MDKIWDRNPSKSELIGRCGGDEKTNDHAKPTIVKCKKEWLVFWRSEHNFPILIQSKLRTYNSVYILTL